ncbi:DUF4276 family protein [Haliangium sp.]|uniref:DUF4276 family protein n=1 Tax=Haliangium sp. TaxID=2663208 RepID=UPI003D0A62BB
MRVYAVVEGKCEEAFLKTVVAEHLAGRGIWLRPMRVLLSGGGRGGGSSWPPWQRHIARLLKQERGRDVRVTTMLDSYKIPKDTPGWTEPGSAPGFQRADQVLSALAATITDPRFIPYVQVYEFETFIFVDLPELARHAADIVDAQAFAQLERSVIHLSPEQINDDPSTAPSKRILACAPGFRKMRDGVPTVSAIGLGRLREGCPRFDAWLRTLEQLPDSEQP